MFIFLVTLVLLCVYSTAYISDLHQKVIVASYFNFRTDLFSVLFNSEFLKSS